MARQTRHRRKGRRQNSSPSREEIVSISALGSAGDGVADISGRTVHVPFVLPAEKAKISVQGQRVKLLEILEASANREKPQCMHFGPDGDSCGSCAVQHMPAADYTSWKLDKVHKSLSLAGLREVEVLPVKTSPPASRRRANFAIEHQAGEIVCGFHERQTHRLIGLKECPILLPALFEAQQDIVRVVHPLFQAHTSLKLSAHVTVADNGLDADISGPIHDEDLSLQERQHLAELLPDTQIKRLTINGDVFWQSEQPVISLAEAHVPLPPRSFLQATKQGEAALQAIVRSGVRGAKKIADFFSGCGTFTFAALAEGASVHAVESDVRAIEAINHARKLAGHPVTTEVRDLFHQPLMPAELNTYDAVIIDPPRAGAEAQALQLAQSK
ncbi:MAG: RsmD family RNA methyltransferase, partial [Aquisalinus sp.]|nr:RsmD family RNA methyltransferase [Aquisalinus sp.]